MNREVLLAALLTATSPALAAPCIPEIADPVPACMVGVWSGTSNMAEVLEAFFATLPEDVRAMARAPAGGALFLNVGAAGQYYAAPLSMGADATFSGDAGSSTMQVDVTTTGATGQFYTSPTGQISFCNATGGASFTISGDGARETGMIPAMGAPAGAAPPMRYTCEEANLQIMVDLPPPMSTVTYSLNRVDAALVPREVLDLLPPAP